MDFSQINDLTTLKAMAYDFIAMKEDTQRKLDAINMRIAEVAQRAMNVVQGQPQQNDPTDETPASETTESQPDGSDQQAL